METEILSWPWPRNRGLIKNSKIGAFGCSHTWGVGVNYHQTWPYLLDSNNFGFAGGSTDFISRNLSNVAQEHKLEKIYILYPNYTRFEYTDKNKIIQSLPTDKNRRQFRKQNQESWLIENHQKNKNYIREFCKKNKIVLIDLEFEDLHQYIDYPDTWPRADDGMHFSSQWHTWVAEVFKKYEKT